MSARRRPLAVNSGGGASSSVLSTVTGLPDTGCATSNRTHRSFAMALTIAELSDREEIRQVMYKFFRATDRRDRQLARSAFWEDGHCESGESRWMPSNLSDEFGARFERDFES